MVESIDSQKKGSQSFREWQKAARLPHEEQKQEDDLKNDPQPVKVKKSVENDIFQHMLKNRSDQDSEYLQHLNQSLEAEATKKAQDRVEKMKALK